MPPKTLQKAVEYASIGIFVSSILYIIFLANEGILWEILGPESIIAALSIIMALMAAVASIVASYAFVFFQQDRHMRNLILSILGGVMIPVSLLYLISHPGFPFVTPFPPMSYKNDVISLVAGAVVGIGLLAAVLVKERVASKRETYQILTIGIIVTPIIIFLVAIIPESVLPDWELINNLGLLVGVVIYGSNVLAIIFYSRIWRLRSNSIPTGIVLGLTSFSIGSTLIILETTANQVIEIASMFMIFISFTLLVLPMMATSITEPHRGLSEIIRERTKELSLTRDESTFYLNIWTHEVGNILQGILMYLESLELLQHGSKEIANKIQPAKALTDRATQTIRQVAEIASMKDAKPNLRAINVESAIDRALKSTREQNDMSSVKIQVNQADQEISVYADTLFSDIISKLLSNTILRSKNRNLSIHIITFKIASTVHIEIRDDGTVLTKNAREYLTGEASVLHSEIGLDLFIVRNLLQRYHGKISIEKLEITSENLTLLRFEAKNKPSSNVDEYIVKELSPS
ncbi:MAG: sensor histidine kinase [Candidatus Thorarchaeota archaeon]